MLIHSYKGIQGRGGGEGRPGAPGPRGERGPPGDAGGSGGAGQPVSIWCSGNFPCDSTIIHLLLLQHFPCILYISTQLTHLTALYITTYNTLYSTIYQHR